jgi:hypothetical protein
VVVIGNHNIPREKSQPELHAKLAMTYLHPWPMAPPYNKKHSKDPLKHMLDIINQEDFFDHLDFKLHAETWLQAYSRHVTQKTGVGSDVSQRLLLNNEVLYEGIEMRQKEMQAKDSGTRQEYDNDHQGHDHPEENQNDPTRVNYDDINEEIWRQHYLKNMERHLSMFSLDGLVRRAIRNNLYKIKRKTIQSLKTNVPEHSTWT